MEGQLTNPCRRARKAIKDQTLQAASVGWDGRQQLGHVDSALLCFWDFAAAYVSNVSGCVRIHLAAWWNEFLRYFYNDFGSSSNWPPTSDTKSLYANWTSHCQRRPVHIHCDLSDRYRILPSKFLAQAWKCKEYIYRGCHLVLALQIISSGVFLEFPRSVVVTHVYCKVEPHASERWTDMQEQVALAKGFAGGRQ